MKPYILSVCAGLLVEVVYGLLNVRSPAPPVVALVGLFGILLGEQVVPVGKAFLNKHISDAAGVVADCRVHIFGQLPQRALPGILPDTGIEPRPSIRAAGKPQ